MRPDDQVPSLLSLKGFIFFPDWTLDGRKGTHASACLSHSGRSITTNKPGLGTRMSSAAQKLFSLHSCLDFHSSSAQSFCLNRRK